MTLSSGMTPEGTNFLRRRLIALVRLKDLNDFGCALAEEKRWVSSETSTSSPAPAEVAGSLSWSGVMVNIARPGRIFSLNRRGIATNRRSDTQEHRVGECSAMTPDEGSRTAV
jgi:hypothetical protein